MNSEDKRKVKVGIAIAAFTILFYLTLQNLDKLSGTFSFLMNAITPFIIGIAIAFVLNLLMVIFEEKLLSRIDDKRFPKLKKFKRPVAVIVTVIITLGIVSALVSFIIPQLSENVKKLSDNITTYIPALQSFAETSLAKLGLDTDLTQTITDFLTNFSNTILNFIGSAVPKIFEITKAITAGLFNIILGFVISIYLLFSKEILLRQAKRIIYAFMPKTGADYTKHVYRLVKTSFSGFVTGQLTEAVIVGMLCFIGMSIFNMEYALLISVIIGITNMIPIIGPFIGAVPGVLIMLMVNPMTAVWFALFIFILQQLESSLIYPRVVGDSIGLPGIWVLFAITLGGALFGFGGILLGVPAFAVIYTLIKEHTTVMEQFKAGEFEPTSKEVENIEAETIEPIKKTS